MAKSKQPDGAATETTVPGWASGAVKPGPARVCDPSDRAGDGLRRFKLRLDGHPAGARSQRYVLAAGRAEAEAEFLRAEGIDPADVGGPQARVVVTELPD